jgi:hypothetical protein
VSPKRQRLVQNTHETKNNNNSKDSSNSFKTPILNPQFKMPHSSSMVSLKQQQSCDRMLQRNDSPLTLRSTKSNITATLSSSSLNNTFQRPLRTYADNGQLVCLCECELKMLWNIYIRM